MEQDPLHGQECCKFFSFVRIKVFHRKRLIFGGFIFYWNCQMKQLFFLFFALVEKNY